MFCLRAEGGKIFNGKQAALCRPGEGPFHGLLRELSITALLQGILLPIASVRHRCSVSQEVCSFVSLHWSPSVPDGTASQPVQMSTLLPASQLQYFPLCSPVAPIHLPWQPQRCLEPCCKAFGGPASLALQFQTLFGSSWGMTHTCCRREQTHACRGCAIHVVMHVTQDLRLKKGYLGSE